MSMVTVTEKPIDETYRTLGHELRFSILEALNESTDPLPFTELRKRVRVDDPGQFNYPLDKLTPRFVRVDGETYQLTSAGRRVIGAMLAGDYTKELHADPVSLETCCPDCGDSMEIVFLLDRIQITCTSCDRKIVDVNVPPGLLEGIAVDEIPDVVDRWLKRLHETLAYGYCDNCSGHLDRTIQFASDGGAPDWMDEMGLEARVQYTCRRCTGNWQASVETVLLFEPRVVAFHYRNDTDLREARIWDVASSQTASLDVTNEDPLRLTVSISLDEEELHLVLDQNLNIMTER